MPAMQFGTDIYIIIAVVAAAIAAKIALFTFIFMRRNAAPAASAGTDPKPEK